MTRDMATPIHDTSPWIPPADVRAVSRVVRRGPLALGGVASVSFYPATLPTSGEGGMLRSPDSRLLARVRDRRGDDERRRHTLSLSLLGPALTSREEVVLIPAVQRVIQ